VFLVAQDLAFPAARHHRCGRTFQRSGPADLPVHYRFAVRKDR